MRKWLYAGWYVYLFKELKGLGQLFCRIGGHKCGVVWYNGVGLEPNMNCKKCGEFLG